MTRQNAFSPQKGRKSRSLYIRVPPYQPAYMFINFLLVCSGSYVFRFILLQCFSRQYWNWMVRMLAVGGAMTIYIYTTAGVIKQKILFSISLPTLSDIWKYAQAHLVQYKMLQCATHELSPTNWHRFQWLKFIFHSRSLQIHNGRSPAKCDHKK